jgi:hypothetical protein
MAGYSGWMLHLIPDSAPEPAPRPYAEAVSRLASVRHAMRLVDSFGGGPASDPEDDSPIADAWDEADEAKRRVFDARSARLVGTAAAGIEALLEERQAGREPRQEAAQALVEQIRRELADIARTILD